MDKISIHKVRPRGFFDSSYFKLSAVIVTSLLLIEAVLLYESYLAKEVELLEIQSVIRDEIKNTHGIEVGNFLKKVYIEKRMREFIFNVSVLVLIIITLTSAAFLVAFHLIVGRSLRRLHEFNRAMDIEKISLIPPSEIPDNEIGDIAISQNLLIERIHSHLKKQKKLHEEIREQQKVSYHQAKLASIGELAAGVGHEINNPLAILHGYIGLIKNEFEKAEDANRERIADSIDIISNASERIKKIVASLKSFSRVDSDEKKEYSMSQIVTQTLDLVREIYLKEGIELSIDMEEDLYVMCSGGRLQQVIINLLTNARDAIAFCDNPQIHLSLHRIKQSCVLSIKDNGCGIPEDVRLKIFEPFYTTKDVNEGAGIGLFLVNQVVRDHNGEITLESEEGVGSIFRVALPLSGSQLLNKNESGASSSRLEFGLSALVVEDDPAARLEISEMLTGFGIECNTAKDGIGAVGKIEHSHYDFVIIDLRISQRNGCEFIERLRLRYPNSRTKIFVSTNDQQLNLNNDSSKCLTFVGGIIYKPFAAKNLEEVLLSNYPVAA